MNRGSLWKEMIKRIGAISLVLVVTVSGMWSAGVNEVYADVDAVFEASISGFPESYKPYLRNLHESYPNWSFQPQMTNIDFATAVENESIKDRSLTSTSYSDYLQSNESGDYNTATGKYIPKDGSTWVTASRNAVAYFMDPRNFLNDTYIFMFENLAYDPVNQTQQGVEAILAGSFMANTYISYIDTRGLPVATTELYSTKIMEAAQVSQVSAYYIASKILQEIGSAGKVGSPGMGASGSISGNYSPLHIGIYNFYNIGASTSANPILNGLSWAHGKNGYGTPWDTPSKSIIGGAQYIGEKFINVGQNTTYLQRFNVTSNKTYTHQYMTNIFGCAAETATTAKAYANLGIKGNQRTFMIPVYNNMPGDATTVQMGKAGDKAGVINDGVNVRSGPSTSHSKIVTLSAGDVVTIKECVLTDRDYAVSWLNNPYWCKIEGTKNGVAFSGYVAASFVDSEIESSIIAGTTINVVAVTSQPGETVYYRSDNPAIATVDAAGNITGVSTGMTTIRAFAACGNFATYTVDVFEKGCVLNKKKATINLKKKLQLTATVYPADAPDKTVTWTSSNPSIATVSATGKVKGVGVGKATITARAAVGGAEGKCVVTVVKPVTGVTLNKTSKTMSVGSTYTLKATVKPDDATIKTVKWKSSNTAVAKVKKGVVTAVAPGTATITVTTKNGSKTATAVITVVAGKLDFTSVASYNYNTIRLKWNSQPNVSGYLIYRKNSAGKYVKIAKVPATQNSYKDKKLTTGTTYSYKIRSYTMNGNKMVKAALSAPKSARPVPKKGKITSLTAVSESKVRITWKRDSHASGYQIYRKSSSDMKFKRIKTVKKNKSVTYTDKKLMQGQIYYYRMRSYRIVSGKKVYGKYSKVVSLTK